MASEVVQLPSREGGLGLRSAARLAPAAYWASWADCLSLVYARAPHVCAQLLQELEGPASRAQFICGKPRTQPRCWPVKAWRCQSGVVSCTETVERRDVWTRDVCATGVAGAATAPLFALPRQTGFGCVVNGPCGMVGWLIGCEIVCMKCVVLHASSPVPCCRVLLIFFRNGVLCTWFFRLL